MAIIKRASNMYSQIEEEYTLVCGDFTETSQSIIVDSAEENLSLNSNMKILTHSVNDGSQSDQTNVTENKVEIQEDVQDAQVSAVINQDPLIVLEIEGPEEAIIGKKVKYKVKELSRAITKKELKEIKWAVEIDNDRIVELKDKGEEIIIEFLEDWRGFNVRILSYMTDIEDEAYFEVTTIKYIKSTLKTRDIEDQGFGELGLCAPTVFSYISKQLSGTSYEIQDYFTYYQKNYNAQLTRQMMDGVDFNDIPDLVSRCFEEDKTDINLESNINNGKPIIFGLVLSTSYELDENNQLINGMGNGHCLAIVGYRSDRKIVIFDPAETQLKNISLSDPAYFGQKKVIVNGVEKAYIGINPYLFYIPVVKSKKIN